MNLQPLNTSHLEQLIFINNQTQASSWSPKIFEETLQNPTTHGFVCFDNNTLVGFVIFNSIFERVEILNIAVVPNLQRKGLGQNLIDQVFLWGKNNFSSDIFLEVREKNINAISFYKKNGFVLLSRRMNYYSDNETACVMKKDLKAKNGLL